MKAMVVILYVLSSLGIITQAVDILPGVPDRITVAVIVMGLVFANIIQWRQAIKDREDFRNRIVKQSDLHRAEIKEMNQNTLKMVMENAAAIQKLFDSIQRQK